MTDAPVALDLLRRQLAGLLSQIDSVTLPPADKIRSGRKDPGREWHPTKGWEVFTVEEAGTAGVVYVDHRCDSLDYRWGEPNDWEALRIEDARRIGMAFLAAAARAEELLEGVTRLDSFRRQEGTEPEPPKVRTLRTRSTKSN